MKQLIIDGKEIRRDTCADLFNNALRLARDAGELKAMDEILDYALPSNEAHLLTDYRFNVCFLVNYGCEGIYIDAFLNGQFEENFRNDRSRISIGTLKTLREDLDAMKIMGGACGVLTCFATRYVNTEIDRYTPEKQLIAEAEQRKQRKAERGGRNV
jgi:hypothetical protein